MIFRALIGSQLLRERLRSAMTVLAVALGVALVLAIDLANATAVASFSQSVNIIARHVNLQVLAIGPGFREDAFSKVLALDGVRDARPVIESSLTIGAKAGDPMSGEVLHILGTDLLRPLPDPGEHTTAAPQADISPNTLINLSGAIVSRRVATNYHLRVGSVLHGIAGDRSVDLLVAAILPAETPGIDSSVIFLDIATAQQSFAHLGLLDRIDLEVDPQRLTQVRAALTHILPANTRVITPATRNTEIERMLQSFALNLQALAAIALLVGLFLVFNTVAISVVQRRNEIGILRGLGATRTEILRSFLQEGLLFGVVGSLLGVLAGVFLARGAVGAVSKTVATLYVSTHADGVVYSVLPFMKAIILGIGSSVLAAVVPAQEAAQILPAALIRSGAVSSRNERSVNWWLGFALILGIIAVGLAKLPALDGLPIFGYVAALLAIGAGAALTPPAVALFAKILSFIPMANGIGFLITATNMRRSRARTSIAVATLMTAIGMTVSIAVLVGSFRTTVVAWASESLKADLFVRPLGFTDGSGGPSLSPDLETRLGHLPGVMAVDTFRASSIPFQGRITTLGATEMHSLIERPRLRLIGLKSLQPYANELESGNGVLISEPFVNRFGLEPGATFTIATPSGQVPLRVIAVYNDYSSDSGFILMDRQLYARLFHTARVDSLAVYAKHGADLAVLRSSIMRAAQPSQIDIESTRELRSYVITVFDHTFAITYALYVIALFIAGLGIVSTLFALVLERRREMGIMRYLGMSVAGVRNMILTEAASIGLLGGTLGVVLGVALALDLIYVINRQSFGWLIELTMPWKFLGSLIIIVVAAAMLAGLIPARIAARIRTSEALREE